MKLIHEILDNVALESSNKVAIISKDKSITYGEIQKKSFQIGRYFLENGIKKGDRILLNMSNNIELVCLVMGISRVGSIAVVINPSTTTYNLNYIIKDCNPKLIIHENPTLSTDNQSIPLHIVKEEIEKYDRSSLKVPNDISELDNSLFIYTSGSTGNPKAVVSTHFNVIFCTKMISKVLEINEEDIIGNFLPFSFDYGLYQIFLSFYNKSTLAIGDSSLAGIQLIKCLKEWKVTVLPSMPHLTEGLIKLLPRYKKQITLRVITNTGENLPHSHILKIKELIPGCKVYPMYGLTECKRVSILKPNELESKPGSVGRPLPQVKCYVVDENNKLLGPEQVGQLVVKGSNVMRGYWNNTNLTREKFKEARVGPNNVLYTGDLFKIDNEGYLYFIGRLNDLYKKNGFRISAKEIEEAVYSLNLAEIAVLIPPDQEEKNSRLFIKTDKSTDYIKEKLLSRLEYYKIPDKIIILDEFPISINKKIDKKKLRDFRS
ncbi:class I adenylate-forming enzyme family protein [Bacillus basilensis]|uniref:class I adenylate-forming enzyme family protein n=1 Tax=Bacillus cereus group TaxID=86661 RepID=UPI000BEBE79F|nr:AMP-binding protein [Bacillus toyonensis]PEC12825.1 AMP-dependent synthetase [Bacillus toyonensis]